jgi:hypothetical protein
MGEPYFLWDVHCLVSQDPGRKVVAVVEMEGVGDKGGSRPSNGSVVRV